MKITFLGHASLHIEIDGTHIIVDPFISANENAKHIDIDALRPTMFYSPMVTKTMYSM